MTDIIIFRKIKTDILTFKYKGSVKVWGILRHGQHGVWINIGFSKAAAGCCGLFYFINLSHKGGAEKNAKDSGLYAVGLVNLTGDHTSCGR